MSPKLKTSKRRSGIGKDRDEPTGAAASGSDGPSQEWGNEAGGCRGAVKAELPAGEEDMGTVSGRRRQRVEASKRRWGVEPEQAQEIPGTGAAHDTEEILWGSGGKVWTHTGGRALGE